MAQEFTSELESQISQAMAAGMESIPDSAVSDDLPAGTYECKIVDVTGGERERDGSLYLRVGLEVVGGKNEELYGRHQSQFFNLTNDDPEKQAKGLTFMKRQLRRIGIKDDANSFQILRAMAEDGAVIEVAVVSNDEYRPNIYFNKVIVAQS